jgi:hypothetical protein
VLWLELTDRGLLEDVLQLRAAGRITMFAEIRVVEKVDAVDDDALLPRRFAV